MAEDIPTLVGIDHGFSFPLRYFEVHHLLPDWPTFLDEFQAHWPTDEPHTYVDFVRDGVCGNGAERMGSSRWRRICEERCRAYPLEGATGDQRDAYAVASWLRNADSDGRLALALTPELTDFERAVAGVEGWILGQC